jgi:hypothetical protein
MRSTWLPAAAAAAGLMASLWLYRENRDLRAQLAAQSAAVAPTGDLVPESEVSAEAGSAGPSLTGLLRAAAQRAQQTAPPPRLEEPAKESRIDRRKRRQQWLAAMFGRGVDESEAEYRERMVPMIERGLEKPRVELSQLRGDAERAAGVTAEQSAKLDEIFGDVHAEAVELTNRAIRDGELTPYERNVTGLLTYVGGLGAVLGAAETRVGDVLSAKQWQRMRDTGFDLGEYLGVTAPWETLTPPPPPPQPDDRDGRGGS